MIDGVGEGFFERLVGEVVEALRLGPARMLDDTLAEVARLDVGQCLAQHAVERTPEDFLLEAVAARAVREIDDIDLGLWEELVRLLVEEEQADVARKHGFCRSVHDLHLAAQGLEIHLGGGLVQVATDGAEEGADQAEVEIGQGGALVHPVVEGDIIGETEKLSLVGTLGADGVRSLADEVGPFRWILPETHAGFVWAGCAAGCPKDEDVPSLHDGRLHDRVVERLDGGVA